MSKLINTNASQGLEVERYKSIFTQIDRLIEEKGGGIIAIEGGSAAGKTTLAKLIADKYECNVFHMDDFFLRPEQRTKERLDEPGGNVDRERFKVEVLESILKGEDVCYRRYSCQTQTLQEPVKVKHTGLTVIEGAYSMHPELDGNYDLSVFLKVTPELQMKRIGIRNTPEKQEMFKNVWIPMEMKYQKAFSIEGRCDLVIEINS